MRPRYRRRDEQRVCIISRAILHRILDNVEMSGADALAEA